MVTPALDDRLRRQLLATFLRTRRTKFAPQTRGFLSGIRRRTPGLRQKEVASRANVRIDWYTALEEAQEVRSSAQMLASIADVLLLAPHERKHLFFLAGQFDPDITMSVNEPPHLALNRILSSFSPYPAYLLDRLWNYVGWNQDAAELFDLSQEKDSLAPNLVWMLFADSKKRRLYPQWNEVASHVVSEFRAEMEPLASLPEVQDLIRRLKQWTEFTQRWSTHPIVATIDKQRILVHPDRGRLVLDFTTFRLAGQHSLKLIVYTPVS